MTKKQEELRDASLLACLYDLRSEILMFQVLPTEEREMYINAEFNRLFGVKA